MLSALILPQASLIQLKFGCKVLNTLKFACQGTKDGKERLMEDSSMRLTMSGG
jgi:hypothetical protein